MGFFVCIFSVTDTFIHSLPNALSSKHWILFTLREESAVAGKRRGSLFHNHNSREHNEKTGT